MPERRPEKIVITARPGIARKPAVDVTPAQIAALVEAFYSAIRLHPRLGPLFEERLSGIWDAHLERMNRFWRSVLLHSGEYSGQPVVKHNALPDLQEDDFRLWLTLFEATAGARFSADDAASITLIARRIARSLWLARFGTPFNKAPDWLE